MCVLVHGRDTVPYIKIIHFIKYSTPGFLYLAIFPCAHNSDLIFFKFHFCETLQRHGS